MKEKGFSTHDARGLQFLDRTAPLWYNGFSTHDARGLQCQPDAAKFKGVGFSTHDARGLQSFVIGLFQFSESFSTHDARGLQSYSGVSIFGYTVLVPTMHVGCSSEICTKAVSLCSYFITMCCICQVLFPINFRFFILFFCSICFYSDFLVRIPLFHPLNRRENQEFRGTIFYYYLLKCNYF